MKRTAIPLLTIFVATSAHADTRAAPEATPKGAPEVAPAPATLEPVAKRVLQAAVLVDRVAASAVPVATAATQLRVRLLANGAPACGNITYRNLQARRCLPNRQLTVFTALRPRP